MDATVVNSLNVLEDSLNKLISSLTTTNTFSGATSAAHDILSADETLTSALVTLKQHQDNYNTILRLKAQAEDLQNQLKDTVRTCNTLRNEIGQINLAILEESDDEHDTQTKVSDIDYETLLSFAARIGKHNAAAARQAEQDSTRRRAQASKSKPGGHTNGDTTNTSTQEVNDNTTSQTATQESQAALSAINEVLSFQQAAAGMAFPAPDHLRIGVLGQLQLLREQEGEDAVRREVERLVQASEAVEKHEAPISPDGKGTTIAEQDSQVGQRKEVPQPTQTRPQPPKEQKKVNLDFDEFNSDEDD